MEKEAGEVGGPEWIELVALMRIFLLSDIVHATYLIII